MLICCIRLLCDWSFCFHHHIAYTCCFVASYLFLLRYGWSLWRCFVILKRDSVSLLRLPFLSHVHVFIYDMSLVSHLKCPKSCFSSHFCFLVISGLLILVSSVSPHVVSIVSGDCNQYSSAFFCVVFKSLYWYVNTAFKAGKFSSSLFSWHIVCHCHLSDVMPGAWSLVFLFSGPFVLLWFTSRMAPSILRGVQPNYLSLWKGSGYIILSRVVFWFSWDTLF